VELGRRSATPPEVASSDDLTGLLDRREARRLLVEEGGRYRRYGQPMAVALFEVDHLDGMDASFGEGAGDAVVRHVARMLKAQIRSTDRAARWSGRSLMVILPGLADRQAMLMVERFRRTVADCPTPWQNGGGAARLLPFSLGAGIASLPGDARDDRELILAAEEALAVARTRGPGQAVLAVEIPRDR
jgi:two-component system, cell cycle response regulator